MVASSVPGGAHDAQFVRSRQPITCRRGGRAEVPIEQAGFRAATSTKPAKLRLHGPA
jgi:hypothetical protein